MAFFKPWRKPELLDENANGIVAAKIFGTAYAIASQVDDECYVLFAWRFAQILRFSSHGRKNIRGYEIDIFNPRI